MDLGLFGRLSASDEAANNAIKAMLAGDIYAWRRFLEWHHDVDGFFAISNSGDPRINDLLKDGAGKLSPAWFDRLEHVFDEGHPSTPAILRHDVGRGLLDRVTSLLENHARDIPETGFVLYVTEYLRWCVVFRYHIVGGAAQVKYMHGIERPTGIYNVYDLLQTASDETRSIIRNVLKNRAKLVLHRGVLTHVDRFTEASVFGPSIDTLLVHEVLVRLIYDPSRLQLARVLDIGAGSGFLSTAMWTHLSPLSQLAYIDVDLAAISCTARNLDRASADATCRHGIHGPFDTDLFSVPFDLIVANPPYIPAPTELANKQGQHTKAVHGTRLLTYMLRAGMERVAPNGAMLFVYSELAQAEVDDSLHLFPGHVHKLYPGDGFDVMFDVEDVLEDQEWLQFLRQTRGLAKESASDTYRHHIRIVALTHKTGEDSQIASRLRRISDDLAGCR